MSRKRIHKLKKSNNSNLNNANSLTVRSDGWGNLINNLGTANSRTNNTKFLNNLNLSRDYLTSLYTSDAIARQIVNIIVDDAMRGFINADELLLDELKRLNSKQKITDAATWGRLYGGSAIIIFADDGQDMESPINLNRLRKVVSLQIYDRYQISSMPTDINEDFYSEHYGLPEVYTINQKNGQTFRVHRTRIHFFTGQRKPQYNSLTNEIWNDSVLQSCYEPLRNYGQSMAAAAEIFQDSIQTVLAVSGLTDLMRNGGDDLIRQKMQILDMTRNVSNTVFLDAEQESYTKHSSNVTGLSDILEKQQENICASSSYSMTKLFGVTSKGMGNSGNTDSDNMNNTVDAYRCDNIEPCFVWLIKILEAQSEWLDKPESFDWSFPSLKTSNEHEVAKNRLMAAEMDMKYIERGIPVEFLFKKRYSEGGFQTDIFISEEEMDELLGSVELGNDMQEPTYKDVTEIQRQLTIEPVKQLDSEDNIKKNIELKNSNDLDQQLINIELTKEVLKAIKGLNGQ